MKARRSYTQEQIDTALLVLALTGRNSCEASRRLHEQGIDVSPRVLRNWHSSTHADRYAQIQRDHAPTLERQMIGQARDVILRAHEVTMDAVEASAAELKNGTAKDPSSTARNLATVSGILTDKSLLLEGRPTEIHGSDDVDALIARMSRTLGLRADVESTAEEIEPPALESVPSPTLPGGRSANEAE